MRRKLIDVLKYRKNSRYIRRTPTYSMILYENEALRRENEVLRKQNLELVEKREVDELDWINYGAREMVKQVRRCIEDGHGRFAESVPDANWILDHVNSLGDAVSIERGEADAWEEVFGETHFYHPELGQVIPKSKPNV